MTTASNKYPSNGSRSLFHCLGWNDVARTCRRVSQGKRPATNFLMLRENIERVAKIGNINLPPQCLWYIEGVEDVYLDLIFNEVNPMKIENPPDYYDFLPMELCPLTDECDFCRKVCKVIWIFGGLADERLVCSVECGQSLLARIVREDAWLLRLRNGAITPPTIDFMQPVNTTLKQIADIASNMAEWKPSIRFLRAAM